MGRSTEPIRVFTMRFRNAIFACASEAIPLLSGFPRNRCDHASRLLSLFLTDRRLGRFDEITGVHRTGERHVWLQNQDLIVDITADQFSEVSEKIIVTTKSPWHEMLAVESTQVWSKIRSRQWRELYGDHYQAIEAIMQMVD